MRIMQLVYNSPCELDGGGMASNIFSSDLCRAVEIRSLPNDAVPFNFFFVSNIFLGIFSRQKFLRSTYI